MSNLFTMLPFAVVNASLPVIPSGDITLLTELEPDAYEHWIFDNSSASLSGLLKSTPLTAQSTAPTYSSKYLSISGNEGAGLLTPLTESEGQTDTIAVVFKYTTAANGIVIPFGSLAKSADAALGGCSPFLSAAPRTLYSTARGAAGISTLNSGDTIAASTWRFLCVSRKLTASGTYKVLKGTSTVRESSGDYSAYVPAGSGRKIGLGSLYYNSEAGNTLDFAEAVVFNRALSAAEMSALYLRAQARMAARGITI